MAKFLTTTGVSFHLEQLINKANENLILISPFLRINDRIKQLLEDKNRLKMDIRVIYGKNELQPEEMKEVDSIINNYKGKKGVLIPLLLEIQKKVGFLPIY
ncbi:MAG: hypothetical protein KKI06_05950, partial [Euryarchaeota archaeon]|nr:hypothetical protein [Euryarchaeota archaeon]